MCTASSLFPLICLAQTPGVFSTEISTAEGRERAKYNTIRVFCLKEKVMRENVRKDERGEYKMKIEEGEWRR